MVRTETETHDINLGGCNCCGDCTGPGCGCCGSC